MAFIKIKPGDVNLGLSSSGLSGLSKDYFGYIKTKSGHDEYEKFIETIEIFKKYFDLVPKEKYKI